MSHNIRGVVALAADAPVLAAALGVAGVVPLGAGCTFVPLDARAFDALPGAAGEPPEGLRWLVPKVEAALDRAEVRACFAWIETDYFGGVGTQSAALWRGGRRDWAATAGEGVINRALAALGVRTAPGLDAFDTVGLGRFRSMDALRRALVAH